MMALFIFFESFSDGDDFLQVSGHKINVTEAR